jgi:hypothetical protein
MPSDKRRAPRIQPYVAPCRVLEGTRRLTGYLADLGYQGARVHCEAPPPAVGAAVILEVRLGRRTSPRSRLLGEVKWVRARGGQAAGHMFGVTFKELTSEQQRAVESVVEEFRRRAAELA